MKVIKSNVIPFKGYKAINLFGVVFYRGSYPSETVIRHEKIHTMQMKELLYVGFYLWYLLEWIIRLVQYRNFDVAYRSISFENEAYAMQYVVNYEEIRPHYNFILKQFGQV